MLERKPFRYGLLTPDHSSSDAMDKSISLARTGRKGQNSCLRENIEACGCFFAMKFSQELSGPLCGNAHTKHHMASGHSGHFNIACNAGSLRTRILRPYVLRQR